MCSCNSENGLRLNDEASLNSLGDLPENPLLLHPITVSIQPKDSTMIVLYGNDLAHRFAKINNSSDYPVGAILYGITWQFQQDEQWFGANTPKLIKTIERVEFLSNSKLTYSSFDNRGIRKTELNQKSERVDCLIGMKMAVSP